MTDQQQTFYSLHPENETETRAAIYKDYM